MLAAVAAACGGEGQEEPGNPKIEVEPASHDLAVVPLGQRVERTFTTRNTRDAPRTLQQEPTVEALEGS